MDDEDLLTEEDKRPAPSAWVWQPQEGFGGFKGQECVVRV